MFVGPLPVAAVCRRSFGMVFWIVESAVLGARLEAAGSTVMTLEEGELCCCPRRVRRSRLCCRRRTGYTGEEQGIPPVCL